MYEKFFSFSEKPFNTTPDSKFFFPSAEHTEALNSLIYAINERRGFVVITGEIGAGKTTVCRTLLNKLELNTRVALITNTHITPRELIAEILDEFGIEHKGGTKQKLLSYLNNFLIKQLAQDTNVVLIIDEAQNLAPKVLEEVRMLSNLETEKEKLIQIILLGQPQLKVKLEKPTLEQFKQRIAVYYHLNPLRKQEAQEYIMHRLKVVSSNGVAEIFTPKAMDLIFDSSHGIPRLINLICDSALLSGYIYDTRKISDKIIHDVVKERDFNRFNTTDSAGLEAKIYCCNGCQHYNNCQTKWLRGSKGEEQLCCDKCQDYERCMQRRTT
jgi:putative secretion ATPase (PEP-CTERM system associated)